MKTGCRAHVNWTYRHGIWTATTIILQHNHAPPVPPGGRVPHPPTAAQREFIQKVMEIPKIRAPQVRAMADQEFPDHKLDPRQIRNVMYEVHRRATEDMDRLGGDFASIYASCEAALETDPGFIRRTELDANLRPVYLFWANGEQAALAREHSDVLVVDGTYNTNKYGFTLTIGIVVDGFGHSRNVWYCIHQRDDQPTMNQMMRHHLLVALRSPDLVASDRQPSLIAAVALVLATAFHVYCLHHLTGNIDQRLRSALGGEWEAFLADFWGVYRAVSPAAFDHLWGNLLARFPRAAQYLQTELYDCRNHWAWAWIAVRFTLGIRTNGRSEAENRIIKFFTHAKGTAADLWAALNFRTQDQHEAALVHQRAVRSFACYLRTVY